MDALLVQAGCKINLHLAIKDRRPDGYHEIESLFLPLNFGDTLSFELLEETGACDLRVVWNVPHRTPEEIPAADNLVYRALSLFREMTGWRQGLRITLEKRVPTGAGLGGGSADAAAALVAFDHIAHTALAIDTLAELAGVLGSDVPFFLYNTPAYVSGTGARVQRVSCPWDMWVVLAVPSFKSGTAEAYRLLDTARAGREHGDRCTEKIFSPIFAAAEQLKKHPSQWMFYNDFLPVFLKGEHKEAYSVLLKTFKEHEADFCALSGSGSGCFGIFTQKKAAERAAGSLSQAKNFVEIIQSTSCIF